MSNFNARVAQVKLQNYNTPPQNLPQFQNPFLLLSDTEALNQILKDKGGSPNVPAVNETPYIPPADMPTGLNPTNPRNPSGLVPTDPSNPTGLNPVDQPAGLVPTAQPSDPISPPESEPSAPISGGAGRSHPSESMPNRFANLEDEEGDMDDAAHSGNGGPPPPASETDLTENVDDDEGHGGSATTPPSASNAVIANSPHGAGDTLTKRLRTRTANYDGHTSASIMGRNPDPNTVVTATHPPIVPATRLTNHVGVSNSIISSLYDSLTASQKNRITTDAGSSSMLRSSTNPAFQNLLPASVRNNKSIQTYRITSAGNIYAYAYYADKKPIYIGNWRESYAVTNPPFNQPNNPHGTARRAPPVSTNLGNTGTRFNQP